MALPLMIKSYTDKGFKPIPKMFLTDEQYADALQTIVTGTADIVPFDRNRGVIYLAVRKAKPMSGPWYLGGRIKANETIKEAAVRKLQQETTLSLPQDRLQLAGVFDYRWKNRAQHPQKIGCHMAAYTFICQMQKHEIDQISANLDKKEYQPGGLKPYDRKALVKAKVHPAILDVYDFIFPGQGKNMIKGEAEIVSQDDRRTIREFNFTDSAITDIVVHGNAGPLGNHFHAKKEEIFYFAEGSGVIKMVKVDPVGRRVGKVQTFKMKKGMNIRIPQFYAHRFDVEPGTRLFVWNSEPFDMKDMIAHKID